MKCLQGNVCLNTELYTDNVTIRGGKKYRHIFGECISQVYLLTRNLISKETQNDVWKQKASSNCVLGADDMNT
jgi:hypothetical protein